MGKPQQIRDHIAYFLQEAVKAYEIDGVCDRLGMPVVEGAWTYNSKRVYVQNRLAGVPASELLQIAQRVVEEFDDPELEQLLEGGGFRGVDGKLKNIIFAASPVRYAEMVREDRKIRLAGYEVFRFGGSELQGAAGERLVREFFDQLIERTKQ